MSRILQFVLLLLIAIVSSNCKSEELDPSVFINVEDDFYIDMFEDISNGENEFQITIQSIQNQACLDAIIEYDLQNDSDRNLIILSINDIVPPETCIGGNVPAFVSVPLKNINNWDYIIEINLKDAIINRGELSVTDESYYLEMSTEDGFEVLHKKLNKIPKKAIWGYVGYEDEAKKMDAENFVKDIEEISVGIGEAEGYDTGYFGYFTILEDRTILLNSQVEEKLHKSFIYHYDADNQDIIDLIDSYCIQHPDLNIYLFNGEGGQIECP